MGKFTKRIKVIRKNHKRLPNMLLKYFSKFFSDEKYIRMKYKLWFNREINLETPKTFNEKLNWLKLNYRNPQCTVMADKYWVKKWVADKIGSQYVVPCYGHWNNIDEIDFDKLPDRFFLKSNQDSGGGMLIDKNHGIDIAKIKQLYFGFQAA